MCKKLLLVLTAAALLLSMTACSGIRERIDGAATEPSEEKPVISEQSDSASASEPESEATEPAPAVDYDAQIAVLAANYALWVKNGEYDPYSYSVTDLDQNGRLEVIASACLGSGNFSYNDVWEVNEALDGLTQCATTIDESMQPDLTFVKETMGYYNETTGEYAYIFSDAARNGAAEYMLTTMAFTLSDGVLSTMQLAGMYQVYSPDSDEPTVSYYSGDVSLTEEEFLSIADTAFSSCEKYRLALDWATFFPEEAAAMDEAAWLNTLQTLWQSFSLERE